MKSEKLQIKSNLCDRLWVNQKQLSLNKRVPFKLSQGVQYEQMQGFNENAHSKALAPLSGMGAAVAILNAPIGRRLYINELQLVSLQPRLFTVVLF